MLTDENLSALIVREYAQAELPATLAAVELRGRTRHRRTRTALALSVAMLVLAVIGVAAVPFDRIQRLRQAAALDRACQSAYAHQAADLQRSALPARLDLPVLELRSGSATFRLYASALPDHLPMIFDCVRLADGSVSGRITYGASKFPPLTTESIAYEDYLADGSKAVIVRPRDPQAEVTLATAAPDVLIASADGFTVIWGPAAEFGVDDVRVGSAPLGPYGVALTATFQEQAFDAYCWRHLPADHGPFRAALRFWASPRKAISVYRSSTAFAVCNWEGVTDEIARRTDVLPAVSVASSWPTDGSELTLGLTLMTEPVVGDGAWLVGAAPADTERVELYLRDGTVLQAQLGDGLYAAVFPTAPADVVTKTVITTPTTVYTAEGKKPFTQSPRR